jgi:hypothetical protein
MWLLVIGVILLVMLTAAATRYLTFVVRLRRLDRVGACVFFFVVGLPVVIVGLALIAQNFQRVLF